MSEPITTTRYAIADWWAPREFVSDLGEPSCFACHWYDERWDDRPRAEDRWNKAKLDRAHIIARSIGGADEPSNYLLLCRTCHMAAPMTNDPEIMVEWARNRAHWSKSVFDVFGAALLRNGVSKDDFVSLSAEEIIRAFQDLQVEIHPCSDEGHGTLQQNKWIGYAEAAAVVSKRLISERDRTQTGRARTPLLRGEQAANESNVLRMCAGT